MPFTLSTRGVFDGFGDRAKIARWETELVVHMDRIPRSVVIVRHPGAIMSSAVSQFGTPSTEVYG